MFLSRTAFVFIYLVLQNISSSYVTVKDNKVSSSYRSSGQQDASPEIPARKISLLSRPFGLGWLDKNKVSTFFYLPNPRHCVLRCFSEEFVQGVWLSNLWFKIIQGKPTNAEESTNESKSMNNDMHSPRTPHKETNGIEVENNTV